MHRSQKKVPRNVNKNPNLKHASEYSTQRKPKHPIKAPNLIDSQASATDSQSHGLYVGHSVSKDTYTYTYYCSRIAVSRIEEKKPGTSRWIKKKEDVH